MNDELLNIINNFENSGSDFIIGNRNKIKIFDYQGTTINVKSFRIPIWFNGFIYRFFRDSKAKRSFLNARFLIEKGIKTPNPIAFYEKKSGILIRESYYICEHLVPDLIFRDTFDPQYYNSPHPDLEIILKGIAKFSFDLHENGIEFIDHSPGNTLLKKDNSGIYQYYLVDLNRMKFHNEMSFEMRMKNLRKITPSLEMIKVISKEYAKLYQKSETEVFEVLWKYTQKFQLKFIKKQELKNKFRFWKQ